jgi:hypothetical protein
MMGDVDEDGSVQSRSDRVAFICHLEEAVLRIDYTFLAQLCSWILDPCRKRALDEFDIVHELSSHDLYES